MAVWMGWQGRAWLPGPWPGLKFHASASAWLLNAKNGVDGWLAKTLVSGSPPKHELTRSMQPGSPSPRR